MKILVFSDLHGSVKALSDAVTISRRERPDKTVICGDLFGWSSAAEVETLVRELDGVLYLVKGNVDRVASSSALYGELEDYVVMYHFGRTLFFTHGNLYNAAHIPPMLQVGDVMVHGHTHVGLLRRVDGLYVLNVGSLAQPRDGTASYLVLDDDGATSKSVCGEPLAHIGWEQ